MYFEVTLKWVSEETSGKRVKQRKHTERYLVDAMSCTEAEARTIKMIQEQGSIFDFEVTQTKQSRICGVIE